MLSLLFDLISIYYLLIIYLVGALSTTSECHLITLFSGKDKHLNSGYHQN